MKPDRRSNAGWGRKPPNASLRICEWTIDDSGSLCGVRGKRCRRCHASICAAHWEDHAGATCTDEFLKEVGAHPNYGRPPLEDPKCRVVVVRLTQSEYDQVKANAEGVGSMSAYARWAMLYQW